MTAFPELGLETRTTKGSPHIGKIPYKRLEVNTLPYNIYKNLQIVEISFTKKVQIITTKNMEIIFTQIV